MFGPKSVDTIVASLQSTINELKRAVEQNTVRMGKIAEEILKKETQHTISRDERDRALRIVAKLEEVLK